MSINNKIHIKILCIGGEIYSDMEKFEELMCQFCVCYSNIYNPYMYKHETIRNWLIGYLTFIAVNWNFKTTHWLTSYSVKVQSTKIYILDIPFSYFFKSQTILVCEQLLYKQDIEITT